MTQEFYDLFLRALEINLIENGFGLSVYINNFLFYGRRRKNVREEIRYFVANLTSRRTKVNELRSYKSTDKIVSVCLSCFYDSNCLQVPLFILCSFYSAMSDEGNKRRE